MAAMSLRRSFNKWAYGTRCRNADVARILRPFISGDSILLDAGCGEYGLSTFVSEGYVIGLDILSAEDRSGVSSFVLGSIASLPFAERAFSVAASVDVFEHLPSPLRSDAIRQLVEVSRKAVVITFPSGKQARQIDEEFCKSLEATGQPVPDWLSEHLANQYPEVEEILSAIQAEASLRGRRISTSVHYSEALVMSKLVRWAALRSRYLYFVGNIVAGFLLPVLPKAKSEMAYRSIVLVVFENE